MIISPVLHEFLGRVAETAFYPFMENSWGKWSSLENILSIVFEFRAEKLGLLSTFSKRVLETAFNLAWETFEERDFFVEFFFFSHFRTLKEKKLWLLGKKRPQACQNSILLLRRRNTLVSFPLENNSCFFRNYPKKNSPFLSKDLISACPSKLILPVHSTVLKFFSRQNFNSFSLFLDITPKKILVFYQKFSETCCQNWTLEIYFFWKNCFFERFRTMSKKTLSLL